MAEKLKSVLQNLYLRSQLLLFLKSATFGLVLAVASGGDFRILPILIFLCASVLLYARPFFEGYATWHAFFILLAVALLGMRAVIDSWIAIPTVFVFSLIFYILAGIRSYIFVQRPRLYFIAMLLLSYSMYIIFFLTDKSTLFALKYGALAIAIFLIFREWLVIIPSFHFPKREKIAALVAALVLAQLIWATALFPIGFINSANLLLLFTFVIAEFLLKHFTGGITKAFIAQHLIFFLLLSALILFTSS